MRAPKFHAALAAVLATALTVAALFSGLGAIGPQAAHAQPEPTPTPLPGTGSPCTIQTAKVAGPAVVELGATVGITLSVRPDCAADPSPLHLMLVLDGSGSMAGEASRQLQAAAGAFVDRFAPPMGLPPRGSGTRVGLVEIGLPSRALCPLSTDITAVKACIARLGAAGGSDIGGAIALARDALRAGRAGIADPAALREVILLVADGPNDTGCDPVLNEARAAKAQKVLISTTALGDAADAPCLRNAATSARYFFQVGRPGELDGMFQTMHGRLAMVHLQTLTVQDNLPANMAYVSGSAAPAASWAGRRLTWDFSAVGPEGVTMTFKVRPTEPGTQPTNSSAVAIAVDRLGNAIAGSFPVPQVTVIDLPGRPSPTPRPADPEARAEIALSTRELRPGERGRASYRLQFDPPELPVRTHVALVSDASGSMSGDHNRLLKEALGMVIDRLENQADPETRAAVVEFDSDARLRCALTNDYAALRDCVRLIGASGGTAIDRGIQAGYRALLDGRPAPGFEDMVVMSDGANNTGCAPVLAAAQVAKNDGVVVHTVCMGSACDASCMLQAASSPAHFHQTQGSAELPAAFGAIGDRILGDRRVAETALTLTLPPHLRLVPDSVSPPAERVADGGAEWRVAAMPREGLSVSFEIEPVSSGNAGLALRAEVLYEGTGSTGLSTQSEPIAALGFATATPPPTEPTPTAVLGPSRTPEPSPTWKIDYPPAERRLFLPLVLREACARQPVDLALALDTSISMAERAADGGSKLDAAVGAVRALVSDLRLPEDRIALIGFHGSARLLAPLSGDKRVLLAALDSLELGNGTAMDEGLRRAHEALSAAQQRPGSRRVIVLLTDGRSTTHPALAITVAELARSEGITIEAVGLGGEVDIPTLIAIAGSTRHFHHARGQVELTAAFASIARSGACAEAFWGGR